MYALQGYNRSKGGITWKVTSNKVIVFKQKHIYNFNNFNTFINVELNIMATKKMTQVEYDCKMRALREENKLRTAPLRAMLAMKEQEKSVINQQMDDMRKRSRQLGTEYMQICQQIQAVNAEIAERKKTVQETYWQQYAPKEYKVFNNELAHQVRYSVLNSLRDALKEHCHVEDVQFDFHFSEDGNVQFITKLPDLCKTE